MEETENVKWCVFKVPQYMMTLAQLVTSYGKSFIALLGIAYAIVYFVGIYCFDGHDLLSDNQNS